MGTGLVIERLGDQVAFPFRELFRDLLQTAAVFRELQIHLVGCLAVAGFGKPARMDLRNLSHLIQQPPIVRPLLQRVLQPAGLGCRVGPPGRLVHLPPR